MEFSEEIRNRIKYNMLHIITKMKRKPRNYLNKLLQDAVCNYFLENYVAVFLKEDYQVISGRELRQKIQRKLPFEGKKYINLLNKFKSEILRVNKGDEYRFMLSSIVDEEDNFPFESKEWITLSKKKMIALLLLVHWDQENMLNFYDMWNFLFPNDPLIKHKLSKEEKDKQKYLQRGRVLSDLVSFNSSLIKDENSTVLIIENFSSNNPKIALQKSQNINSNFSNDVKDKDKISENFNNQTHYLQEQILSINENDQLWYHYDKKEEQEVKNQMHEMSIIPQLTNNYQNQEKSILYLSSEDKIQYLDMYIDDSSCYYREPQTQKYHFYNSILENKCGIHQDEISLSEQFQAPFIQFPSLEESHLIFNQDHEILKKEYKNIYGIESQDIEITLNKIN